MINDFFTEEGKPLPHSNFIANNGKIISFFKYMAMIDAIPCKWRKMLRNQFLNQNCCNLDEQPFCQLTNTIHRNVFIMSSRELYWTMINEKTLQPSCVEAWNSRLNLNLENSTWEKIFTLPFKCTLHAEIKDFQIKILHRFYASNSLVSKWDKDKKGSCSLCNFEKANIQHIFTECMFTQQFWENIDNWIRPLSFPYTAKLEAMNMLFGIVPYAIGNHAINHCLMYCRYFIHLEVRNNNCPKFHKFIEYYKQKLNIEKETYIVRNEFALFSKLFGKLINII